MSANISGFDRSLHICCSELTLALRLNAFVDGDDKFSKLLKKTSDHREKEDNDNFAGSFLGFDQISRAPFPENEEFNRAKPTQTQLMLPFQNSLKILPLTTGKTCSIFFTK